MAFTLEQLAALEVALASGARRVKFEDREVEYHSKSEIIRAIAIVKRGLGLTDPDGNRSRASLDKELGP